MPYQPYRLRAPRVAGAALGALAGLLEHPVTGAPLARKILDDAGLRLLHRPVDAPLPARHPALEAPCPPGDDTAIPAPVAAPAGFAFAAIADFERAYREGAADPEAVAEKALAAIRADEAASPPLRAFIAHDPEAVRALARASAARHRAGTPVGPLDGVPVAIKDEVDMAGYPTTVGTRFLTTVASEDATVVRRLREAGAVLLGKANMHELGLGVTGFNAHHGTPRNPYDPGRYPGGSSSGSAVAVAAGYCPVALGADGGGSIRIPAALCGLVGLKPTFGRLSTWGAAPLCWSVDALGPIAATSRDAAIAYMAMAGADPRCAETQQQSPPHLTGMNAGHLQGLTLGVYRAWFEDAAPAVVEACQRLLGELVEAGATVLELEIPDLELVDIAHMVTIVSEMAAAHQRHVARHGTAYGLDVRVNLALGRRLGGHEYVQAQRIRAHMADRFAEALAQCDALVTPATAITAPRIPPDALPHGESDLPRLDAIMRFARAANLTGLPAIAFPAGYDGDGLPIGMQAIGRPWAEHTLLRLAAVAETRVTRRAPQVHHRLI